MSEALAVGLMSGTSLDGVDAALVRIGSAGSVGLEAFCTLPYRSDEREHVLDMIASGTVRDLAMLDVDLGSRFADAVSELLERASIDVADVSFIASHGHTIWHEPGRSSLQIGNPAVIAERFGLPVVSDFRSRDVAAGGEGAPLVPIADVDLFGSEEHGRLLLNIGGIANVTWVSRKGSMEGLVAFDTGPGVCVIDSLVCKLCEDESYDESGAAAAAGKPRVDVVSQLLLDEYFQKPPPKSTGREKFGSDFAERLVSLVRESAPESSDSDLISTATLFTAESVRDQVERWIEPDSTRELVVSGGGVHNKTLLGMIGAGLPGWTIRTFEDLFFDGDAKEAVAFAYLGWLTLNGEGRDLSRVTGAAGKRVLGRITPA